MILRRRRWPPGGLRTPRLDLAYFPAAPTLHGALAFANLLAFGHPLGAERGAWKPRQAVRVARAPSGEPVAAAQLIVSRGPPGPPPQVRASAAARSAHRLVQLVLKHAWLVTGSVALYAEVVGVPLLLPEVRIPWPALAQGREGLYAPGFEAYLLALEAERGGERQLLLRDWARWEPRPEQEEPVARKMLLALAKPPPSEGGDGRVIYALWLSPSALL
jgi:hypothetical protein